MDSIDNIVLTSDLGIDMENVDFAFPSFDFCGSGCDNVATYNNTPFESQLILKGIGEPTEFATVPDGFIGDDSPFESTSTFLDVKSTTDVKPVIDILRVSSKTATATATAATAAGNAVRDDPLLTMDTRSFKRYIKQKGMSSEVKAYWEAERKKHKNREYQRRAREKRINKYKSLETSQESTAEQICTLRQQLAAEKKEKMELRTRNMELEKRLQACTCNTTTSTTRQ